VNTGDFVYGYDEELYSYDSVYEALEAVWDLFHAPGTVEYTIYEGELTDIPHEDGGLVVDFRAALLFRQEHNLDSEYFSKDNFIWVGYDFQEDS
jgi:hypothetical protein